MDPMQKHALIWGLLKAERERPGTLMQTLSYKVGNPDDSALRIGKDIDQQSVLDKIADPGMRNFVQRALVSGGTSGNAIVRQDLDPIIYATYLKEFPYFQRIAKFPANGLAHAYVQNTAPGTLADSSMMLTEVGGGADTVTDDASTYARATTNVATFAVRRGISIREMFAVRQGGMDWNPEAMELAAGVVTLSRLTQRQLFAGNATDNASAGATTEKGAYNVNGFTGMRYTLSANPSNGSVQVDITNQTIQQAINQVVQSIIDVGGRPSAVIMNAASELALDNEQVGQVRYDNRMEIVPGVEVNSVRTLSGPLPIITVPGDAIGHYTSPTTSADVTDIYVVDERAFGLPYLGSDGWTTLEIPMGTDGKLQQLYILFGLFGMAFMNPYHMGKVRRPTP